MKTVLIAGAFLGACLFVAGATAGLGVMLGTRALVVSADAARPAILAIAPLSQEGGAIVQLAMRDKATAGN